MDEKQINRFKDIVKYTEQTSYIDAAKNVMFMACLVKNGLTKTGYLRKSLQGDYRVLEVPGKHRAWCSQS